MEQNSKHQTNKYEMQALERPHCSWSEACSACRQPLICQIALYKNTKKHQKYKETRSSEMNIASVSKQSAVKSFTLSPPEKWIFGPNMTKFGLNIGIFGPLYPMSDQKTMQTRCLDGFPLCGYQNFHLLPKFGPKMAFLAKYCHFWPI